MNHKSMQVVRPEEASVLLGVSNSTLWRWARGDGPPSFPKPLKLSRRVTVWRLAELDAWLESQAEERLDAAVPEAVTARSG